MLKKNKIFIVFTTMIMIISFAVIVTTQSSNPDKQFYRNKLLLATDCMTSKDPVNPYNAKKYNTNTDKTRDIMPFQRILCAIDIYGQPENLNQLDLMIETLIEYSNDDLYIRNICHDILHEMGLKAWNRYEDKILKTNYFACGMGFIHGAFSQAFSDKSNQSKNLTLLTQFCDEISLKDINKNDSCIHGIGHGIGNQDYNTKRQLEICEQIKSKINNIRLLTSCLSGSLNQYFYLKTATNSGNIENSVKYCDSLINTEILECYKFALMYTNLSGSEIKKYCDSLPSNITYKYYKYYGCYEAAAMSFIHNDLYSSRDAAGYNISSNLEQVTEYTKNLCAGMVLLTNNEIINLSKKDVKIIKKLGIDTETYYQSYFKYNSCLFRFYSELYEKILDYETFKGICSKSLSEENEICIKISKISKTVNNLEASTIGI
jgi:hypothetical protein